VPVIGARHHEADDVIGTLASLALIPVDVVTGDRDLFQLIDDSREVRAIYTGRGMSRLEILTDAALEAKYGVTPAQYADFAAMRGDASDGLPGVAGVGEKTAVALLSTYGHLDGIVAAAADPASGMAPPVRAKIRAAADYLAVAPAVVKVVRDLKLADFDARIRVSTPEHTAELDRLSDDWGLGSSMKRVRDALGALA
jgi:5'-3' exonuclease